jgi:hypothetical protein
VISTVAAPAIWRRACTNWGAPRRSRGAHAHDAGRAQLQNRQPASPRDCARLIAARCSRATRRSLIAASCSRSSAACARLTARRRVKSASRRVISDPSFQWEAVHAGSPAAWFSLHGNLAHILYASCLCVVYRLMEESPEEPGRSRVDVPGASAARRAYEYVKERLLDGSMAVFPAGRSSARTRSRTASA